MSATMANSEVLNSSQHANKIWMKVLELLSKDLSAVAIETWFKECSAVKFDDGRLFVHTPVTYNKQIIKDRFIGSIKSALTDLFSSDDVDIVILDDDDLKAMTEEEESKDYVSMNEYTFEHFVVGGSNKLAHAAAVAVSDCSKKKQGYNPLFIYGNSGLGKTHLLYAIRYAVEQKYPHYKVVYVKGEDFTNDYINSLQHGKIQEFRNKYRGTDFFLVDDIQFIAGKKETQEEYFNTFNTLHEIGKQIVLTSDRPPKEMTFLESRLQSRFESGLMVDIQPPDEALRLAIVKSKAVQLGVTLPDDVTHFIADNLNESVRQLEGAVKMLMAYRDIMGEEITVDNVKTRLREAFFKGKDILPSADDIINETAIYYMQSPEDLIGLSKSTDTKNARHMAMYLIRRMTNLSFEDIGTIFNRHHSTVIHACKKLDSSRRDDTQLSNVIKDITANIQSRGSGN